MAIVPAKILSEIEIAFLNFKSWGKESALRIWISCLLAEIWAFLKICHTKSENSTCLKIQKSEVYMSFSEMVLNIWPW